MSRLLLLLGAVALSALATHIAWSAALSAAVDTLYDHRIFNVRKVTPSSDFVPFAYRLLQSKARSDKPLILTVGASLTFGYDFSDQLVFSRQIARRFPNATVLNLSVIGAEGPGIAGAVACAIRHSGLRPDFVALELPVINDAVNAKRRHERNIELSAGRRAFACSERPASILWYFLTRPRGPHWAIVLRDDSINTRTTETVRLAPLERDYFVDAETYALFSDGLIATRSESANDLKLLTKTLAVYPGPLFIDGLVKLGFERQNIERQISDTIKSCRLVEGVVCLDPQTFFRDTSVFNDVSHLKPEGHTAFGNWLADRIAEVGLR